MSTKSPEYEAHTDFPFRAAAALKPTAQFAPLASDVASTVEKLVLGNFHLERERIPRVELEAAKEQLTKMGFDVAAVLKRNEEICQAANAPSGGYKESDWSLECGKSWVMNRQLFRYVLREDLPPAEKRRWVTAHFEWLAILAQVGAQREDYSYNRDSCVLALEAMSWLDVYFSGSGVDKLDLRESEDWLCFEEYWTNSLCYSFNDLYQTPVRSHEFAAVRLIEDPSTWAEYKKARSSV